MSLTRDLTKLIRSKPVTDKDLEWAALFVLDTLGCALGALRTEPARMLKAVAPPETSDVPRRAFYLGGLAHILEMDDLHRDYVPGRKFGRQSALQGLAQYFDLRAVRFRVRCGGPSEAQ